MAHLISAFVRVTSDGDKLEYNLRLEKGIQSGLWLVKIDIGSDRKNQHRDQIVFLSDDCRRFSDIAILDYWFLILSSTLQTMVFKQSGASDFVASVDK